MNIQAVSPLATNRLRSRSWQPPESQHRLTLSSQNESAYRHGAKSMGVGALAGAVAGGLTGLALGFEPALLATAGLVTGAWGGLAVGYFQAIRELP